MLKTIELLNIFVETMKLFFQDFTYIVFIVTFDQFNASLLNTSINFIKKKILTRGRPIIGADIKHFTDYRYRPF